MSCRLFLTRNDCSKCKEYIFIGNRCVSCYNLNSSANCSSCPNFYIKGSLCSSCEKATVLGDCNACSSQGFQFDSISKVCYKCDGNTDNRLCSLCEGFSFIDSIICRLCRNLTTIYECSQCQGFYFDQDRAACLSCN